ncbi:RICIN domain-containing protein [Nonomuraea insulae]|uniref:RICIN domain-containing protein n=1 Tax=Nonomuraea insulae TaxID=1616787 RepID=A0ABW1CCZ1_9ACTN
MRMMKRLRSALLVLMLLGGLLALATPAGAFGPSVLFSPSGSCNRPYCTTYVKSAQTNSGRILATFENNNQPANGQTFPIFSSTDDGRSWTKIASVADGSPRHWNSMWTNPNFLVLPQQIGTMPAGTILLAGIVSPPDRSATAIHLYRSNDDGFHWTYVSEVAVGGGQWGSADPTPIWEPFMLVANNKLIVYYSDERDKAGHDQKLVHQTSANGLTWGSVAEDVALPDRALRPGMPVVTRMASGQYIMVFEMVGLSGTPNHYKISSNPESWNAADDGSPMGDGGGSPWIITLPNGRLVYNSYGTGGDARINTTNGTGAWTTVKTTMPRGYSRMLQYVRGTGRVLVLAAEGFWLNTPNPVYYGDVDLGYSAGPYYKLVNRKSGKALDTYQAGLQDGAQLVQWADNGGHNQHWHVTDVGNGYRTLFNRNSGRTVAIWQTSTADGANAVQWVENNGGDQQWELVPTGSYYKIRARHSGKVLSVWQGATTDGARIVQWTDNGGLDQQWQLVPAS